MEKPNPMWQHPDVQHIFFLFFSAFVGACLSHFLDMAFKEEHIFGMWLPWVAKHLLPKDKLAQAMHLEDTPARRRQLIKLAEQHTFWFRPLGGCPACSNIWQGFIGFWIFAAYFHIPWYYILPYLMISNYLTRAMNRAAGK